ncbi:transketolase [Candidatus Saccharibacteria bacterium]|nr:transketolase [Candidatus Saccharibacteria bacterium]
MTYTQIEHLANTIRQDVVRMLESANSGHSAGPLGMADVFAALYFSILRHDPKNPDWSERDICVVSNGHIAPVLYAVLARSGYFSTDRLKTLRKYGSSLQGHPERTKLPGVEVTSGPLGSGLSQAAGMAYVLQQLEHNSSRWIYVTLGDGECNEGNVWEGAMLSAKYKLANLVAIIDRNNIQISGSTEETMPLEDFRGKWESFGWHVQEIDGNNVESIVDACAMARAVTNRPSVIIAHTIPGKGVDFMEYDYKWHGMVPSSAQAKTAIKKLRTLDGRISDSATS